ncbi:MAG TPA: hypothetical protein VMV31_12010 [Terriglobales bacterium]|nr:hypothetical protein [Terriglobales bacterium]
MTPPPALPPSLRPRRANHRDARRSRAGARAQRWPALALRFVLCFAVLPNLPFWLLGERLGIGVPGLVNLDALLLGVLSLFVPVGWVFAAFTADFLLDILYGIRATFGTAYLDTLLSVRYLFPAMAPTPMLWIAAAILGSLALVGLGWRYLRPRPSHRQRWVLAGLVLALMIPWAYLSRQQRQDASAQRTVNHRLGYELRSPGSQSDAVWLARSDRSPAVALAHAWVREHIWAWLRGRDQQILLPTPSATDHAAPLLAAGRPNLVLVLVESWGEADNPALRRALRAPFAAPAVAARYRLSDGLVGFRGQTPAGELRELCDLRFADDEAPLALPTRTLAPCLAWKLSHAGYATLALDSATSFWPGGAAWYRALGFQSVLGFSALHRLGLRTFFAGTFRAIADPQVAALIPGLLESAPPQPHFLFFLTTSAHLPVHLPVPSSYAANCAVAAVTERSPAACGWYAIERRTLQAIAHAATAPGLPPTVFLVVGDHAPPFVGAARRRFDPAEVPFVLLQPRTAPPGAAS